jgi:hypothetical protein
VLGRIPAVALQLASVVPEGDPDIAPFIVLTVLGFAIACFGHLIKSNTLIATGIILVFLAVVLIPLITQGGS